MPSKRVLIGQISSGLIAVVAVVAFQNCSNFVALAPDTLNGSSSAAGVPGAPQAAPDYNSDVLSKMGVKFTDKGNSKCQMLPPVIPPFDTTNEGPSVLKVCPGAECKFHTISAAVAVAPVGATIAVKAGTYNECVRIGTDKLTLQGRGGRPHITLSTCPNNDGNGLLGSSADHFRLENFEFSDPNPDATAALATGITVMVPTASISVYNTYFHNLSSAIYTVYVQDVVVANTYVSYTGHQTGTDPHTSSGIGVSPGTKSFTVTNSIIAHPRQHGGGLSASADTNIVDCVVTADLNDGVSPRILVFGRGMNSTLTNSVMQKNEFGDPQMIIYWERGTPLPADQFTMKNNVFISDRAVRDRDMAEFWATVPSTYANNFFVGPNSVSFSNFAGSHSFESRAAAGLGPDVLPYPGTPLP